MAQKNDGDGGERWSFSSDLFVYSTLRHVGKSGLSLVRTIFLLYVTILLFLDLFDVHKFITLFKHSTSRQGLAHGSRLAECVHRSLPPVTD